MGCLLVSNIEIRVQAAFNPLTCSGSSAVLGSAGGTTIHQNFANAPVANVWYSSSLASSLANADVNGPGSNDINSQFNVDIDNGVCLTNTLGWYYSTLASDTTPANRIPLLPVVFHELAHGLGFQTFTSSSTGAFNGGSPSIWDVFLADAVTGTTWNNMGSNAERQASAISDPNLIWKGPIVTAEKVNFLGNGPALIVTAPGAIAGEKAASAAFGTYAPTGGLPGEIVAAADGAGASTLDGCEALTDGAQISGKIALMVRGNCNFTIKVKNAQNAGAIAAVIDNNAVSGLPGMGGSDPTVTIPSLGISQADGNAIRAQLALPTTVNGTLTYLPTLAGTQVSGGTRYVRMNAPIRCSRARRCRTGPSMPSRIC